MAGALVSVIIPSFNAAQWIRGAVLSALQQSFDAVEVIAVDDGSLDGTAELITREFPSVHLLRPSHGGPSRARNAGTTIAHGEFIQYLDADDELTPHKLAIQVSALNRSGKDVAYGGWQKLVHRRPGNWDSDETVDRRLPESAALALFNGFWCPPAAYLFRRRVLDRFDGWNEGLPVIQDARFVLDCALHGGQFEYCAGIMALYRVHLAGSVSTRDKRAFVRDCFRNANQIEDWWRQRGDLTGEWRKALLEVYLFVARNSFRRDPDLFENAVLSLERLNPRFVPRGPWRLAIAARILGYKRAETLSYHYRQTKYHILRRCQRAYTGE